MENSIEDVIHEEAIVPQLHQEWLTTYEQERRRDCYINSEVMRRIHQSRHKGITNNYNGLGSSNPVLTVQNTQGMILPPPRTNKSSDLEE